MIEPITISELYEYPVTVTDVDFKNNTAYDLHRDLENVEKNANAVVREFLNTVHMQIYDGLIYQFGTQSVKKRIIDKYKSELEKPIKKALIAQGVYLIENGDPATWSGITMNSNGVADVKDTRTVLEKMLCPRAVDILKTAQPNLLYGGE